MTEVTIQEMEQGEEFTAWLTDLLQEDAYQTGSDAFLEHKFLALTSEIGDWIGGLRYTLRGGVAHLMELAVAPEERHKGHAHMMLAAFELHARANDAHLAEFWTNDLRSEALLAAFGWRRVLERPDYIAGETWVLMEQRLLGESEE
jgi:ribosomal protein S18 acetylase RimI-like enzyme